MEADTGITELGLTLIRTQEEFEEESEEVFEVLSIRTVRVFEVLQQIKCCNTEVIRRSRRV